MNEQPWAQGDWANDVPRWNYSNWLPIHCAIWCISVWRKGLGPLCSFVVQLDLFFLTFCCTNFTLNLTVIYQKNDRKQNSTRCGQSPFFFLALKTKPNKKTVNIFLTNTGWECICFIRLKFASSTNTCWVSTVLQSRLDHGKIQSILLASWNTKGLSKEARIFSPLASCFWILEDIGYWKLGFWNPPPSDRRWQIYYVFPSLTSKYFYLPG